MSKYTTRYYKDVTHSCGHIVRYEFSMPRIADREKHKHASFEMSQELAKMATQPCGPCEEAKTSGGVA